MKAKIFVGDKCTGKSRTAELLIKQEPESVWVHGRRMTTVLETLDNAPINENTKLIIFDDLKKNFDYEWFCNYLGNDRLILIINKDDKVFRCSPNLIFITNHIPEQMGDASFDERFKVFRFPDGKSLNKSPETEGITINHWNYGNDSTRQTGS